MTLAYLDTSALTKLYVNEPGQQVMDLIGEAGKVVTSVIAYPEAHTDIRFLTFDPDLAAVARALLSEREMA